MPLAPQPKRFVATPEPPRRPLRPLGFSLLAVVIGVAAGLGAVLFRTLIALVHNLFFLGLVSPNYDANAHTPASPWGPAVILVPVIGAAGVAFLVKNFAPEAKGHGVPEVMDAIYYHKGVIRPVVAVIKALASALSIGTGGSVGREGPIIQIGASFASSVGQVLRLPAWQRITLIAAGAGGGIAATFNTPIGGVLFTVEIMMHEISSRTLVPVAIATATATYVGRFFFGIHPSFVIPNLQGASFGDATLPLLLAYAGLGVITGGVSAAFITSVYGAERAFAKYMKVSYYAQHMTAMLVVGIAMFALMLRAGHYFIQGVGYATIQDILSGYDYTIGFLLVLFALKLGATSLTLGSGASGGVFSPALFMGATIGAAYGAVLKHFAPHLHVNPPQFAVVGMAGVVGGSTGAAMAAIVMIFEMTLDYSVIVPLTIIVAISYGVRRWLAPDSIYTRKLTLRGDRVPEAMQADVHVLRCARDLMEEAPAMVRAETQLAEFVASLGAGGPGVFLVTEHDDAVRGIVTRDAIAPLTDLPDTVTVGDVTQSDFVTVNEDVLFFDILERLRATGAVAAVVVPRGRPTQPVSAGSVSGLITRERIIDFMAAGRDLF
ncbi:MAG TPA: chloride channel protein [Gemmatimonadaceae bacterium]|nr:chloride channel protein [Gemmatimonadaceae bacterium]